MDRQQYTNNFSEHLTDRLKASVLIIQDGVFKSCTGTVTDRGMIRDLIEIMTSRYPAKALRPASVSEDRLLSLLTYLTEWELHAGGTRRLPVHFYCSGATSHCV
ncbi:hypothetical protein MTO96_040573 [Rhipicephalus appendiculatus]